MIDKLEQIIALVREDLNQIKAGRAKPSLVEDIKIEAYPGQWLTLKELASITAPDPQMLVISPWDKSTLATIEKGLSKSDQNLNPVVDGDLIRIKIPALTGETRQQLIKQVWQRVESGKQMLRTVRNDEKKRIQDQAGSAGISEDDIKTQLEDMQRTFDDYMDKLDAIGKDKEAELQEI